jgi:S1-C subfamily serine protease
VADDVIVRFGEFEITTLQDFAFALRQHKAGQEVDVVVVRKGERVTLRATLGESAPK